jgi:putative peptide zinc metalloprotease protein
MNLSEALDAALPQIPKSRLARVNPPRLDPDLLVRDDFLDGEPIIGILQRDKGNFFRFHPVQWQLAQLFDGVRAYDEIAQQFNSETGTELSVQDVKDFAAGLDESEFWYKTPQEKNIAMSARLMAQRGRRANRKGKINLSHISFSAWDPDRYLTLLDNLTGRYIYSYWSVLAVVALFLFEAGVFVAKWNVLGPDIPLFFNFTHKSFFDLVEFWLLLFGLGFIHETAHGLTCKHYGGEVHSMGLMLLYLTPAFFVDVTESWVSATKMQRLATIIAGIWIEMIICGFAMIIWTNTPPGTFVYDITYKIILITGLAVVVMNLNPLLKLDGYYFLTEVIGVPDLKERSTAFVSAWFQNRILRLPIEVPAIPRRRLTLFVLYALISGGYSYLLLFAVIRFSYNLTSKVLAEFALIPAGLLAFTLFRGRLNALRAVIVKAWRGTPRSSEWLTPKYAVALFILLVLLFAPILRDREDAYFLVEAPESAAVHATVSGRVDSVFVREGQKVRTGQPLLRISSDEAAGLTSGAKAATNSASFQAFEAEMQGRSIGGAAAGQEAARRSSMMASEAQASLLITAAKDGTVLTPDPGSLLHQRVGSGEKLLTVASVQSGVAQQSIRLFVPSGALHRIQVGAEIALDPPGRFSIVRGRLPPIDGTMVTLPPGLLAHQDYKGLELPTFYSVRLVVAASTDGAALPLGTAGRAKIFGARRSVFSHYSSMVLNLVRAHIW